jgi:hypothetical protein
VLLLVSLTEERAIYLAFELDRSWTEMMIGVNPKAGRRGPRGNGKH